ncbi:unnamed protein product [Orchesella dallaii]|uniref:Alpha-mannosidase n=1 Tax=Orchesella dallaii TaxID=48710 RepID=A0ABP1RG02_9HEXA
MILVPFSWRSLLLVLFLTFIHSASVEGTCGYSSCPKTKDGYINVHLVPHSHDDVGWLKTVDQYYYGDNNKIQLGAVQYTLDSVVSELQKSPDRRFIYVESAFFWRWWTNQDAEMQGIVTRLVNNGQLEFILGGWVMNDEACSHYNSIIDQMTLGLRFLNDTFGQCARPRVAWQIDPFGHSREQASLFAQMGFDGLFFGRLDYQDKEFRKQNHDMEMIWDGSPNNLGNASWLFTGALYNGYNPPDGYCFDIFCEDDPINDDPKLSGYNLEEKVNNFINIAQEWAEPYDTGHVLMTMGSDFQYMAAHTWYKNLDKLIKYVNRKQISNSSRVNVLYSTPSCYLKEVHRSKRPLSVKKDDFFPYASDPHAFWTGYFSSRPTLKYFVQKANNFLQVCKQLAVGAFNGHPSQEVISKVRDFSEPVGIAQHHDAVSGTAKQHVTDDYSLRLTVGMKSCEKVVDEAFRKLQRTSPSEDQESNEFPRSFSTGLGTTYEFCHLLNISVCTASETMNDFVVSIYNPLARDLHNTYIRIPVSSPLWDVQGQSGLIPSQIVNIPQPVLGIPGRRSKALYELVFPVESLPGLSLSNFQVTRNTTEHVHSLKIKSQLKAIKKGGRIIHSSTSKLAASANLREDFMIKNSNGLAIVFDSLTGMLKSVIKGSVEVPVQQNFYFYLGMAGDNSKFEKRASGAYIFRPNTTESQPSPITERVFSYQVYKGSHVTEVHQVFTEWISQVIRLYDKTDLVEFEWMIGPVPVEDNYGKEIITRYSTGIPTNGVFFTDANGRQLVKRKRDTRATWPYKKHENVSGNYYPVNSRILISSNEDLSQDGLTLAVLNDRSQGGTSMNDGEIELMLHRRLLFDDAFGVGEPLNETAFGTGLVARGKHWLLLAGEGTGVSISKHREVAQNIFMDKMMGFADVSLLESTEYSFMRNAVSTRNPDLSSRNTVVSGLTQVLPANVHLLTLEPVSPTQFLLRLEHFYEKGEDPVSSKPVTISLEDLKKALPSVKSIRETTLGGNQWIQDMNRFDWIPRIQQDDNNHHTKVVDGSIVLNPMEIKTFLVFT